MSEQPTSVQADEAACRAADDRPGRTWQYTPTTGNTLTLQVDGDEAFARAFEAIRQARSRVWLETYIFEPDEVGNLARDALADAARRGCDVILLFDRWGSPRISRAYARPILDAGGRVAAYNPALPWQKLGRKLAPILHRDHRKILITDDVAFCGGRNVSTDYGGPGPERFYDLSLELSGPVVRDLADVFLGSLLAATGEAPALPPRPAPRPDGMTAQVLVLNRRKNEQDLDLALKRALEAAQTHCFLMTPYFIPFEWFKKALIDTARRGVDTRIFTAGKSDVPLARVAGRHLYGELMEAGVRIYEMLDPTLHAKCITLDGCYSVVGSYNVDAYGGKHNLELGIASTDEKLAQDLEREFYEHAGRALEVTPDTWAKRPFYAKIAPWLLYHLFSV